MRLVDKVTMSLIREISQREREALVCVFASKNSEPEQVALAQSLVLETRKMKAWVQCDCSTEPAFLFPRLMENDGVTLVRPRPPRQRPHSSNCPFHLAEWTSASEGTSEHHPLPPRTIHACDYSFTDGLTELLLLIVGKAGLNHIGEQYPFGYREPIKNTVATIPYSVSEDRMMSDVFSFVTSKGQIFGLMKKIKLLPAGDTFPRRGFALAMITHLETKQVTLLDGSTIPVALGVESEHGVGVGPYWALMVVAERKVDSGYFEVLHVATWPIYTQKLPCIVRTDFERATLRLLLSWKLYWKERGLQFEITKPCKSPAKVSTYFILEDMESGRKAVVESVGDNDSTYSRHSEYLKVRLNEIGPIVEHEPLQDGLAVMKKITDVISH